MIGVRDIVEFFRRHSSSVRLDKAFRLDYMVVQPTARCNLDCTYCYIENKKSNNKMTIEVARSLADSIGEIKRPFQLIWHGGEPLTCGVDHFEKLFCAFQDGKCKKYITHCVQTNATLINEDWISLFKKYKVNVGVSIDGDFELTKSRRFPNGNSAYDSIISGIEMLKQAEIPFSAICVVSKNSLDKAHRIYRFFQDLKPVSLGFKH